MSARQKRTYGSKKSTATPAAAAIFGNALHSTPAPASESSVEDITKALSRYSVNTSDNSHEHHQGNEGNENDTKEPSLAVCEDQKVDISVLTPLISVYKKDSKIDLKLLDWDEILPEDCALVKIAEASYAEVYRIATSTATSIIKIMPLRVPYDLSAERETAQEIKSVIPEIRIMNAMTEIPGFVTFKGAHLAIGSPSEKFVQAWESHVTGIDGGSQFKHPGDYAKTATFLAIELGDAGEVLEDVQVENIDQFWDIFLGVTIALTRAEALNEFEHRDLHENNICVYQHPVPTRKFTNNDPAFGRSGIEVTIIDYGLSRAKLASDEIVFKDLEEDLEVFQGTDGKLQFDTYRRMRNHLFTGEHILEKKTWHTESSKKENNGHTWREYTPYSNVLWLRYLFKYLTGVYHNSSGDNEAHRKFHSATQNLRGRFNVRTKIANGAFTSAKDVLDYCMHNGWINREQIEEIDADGSFFSQASDDQYGR